jgi:hypothetical protein
MCSRLLGTAEFLETILLDGFILKVDKFASFNVFWGLDFIA